MGTQARAVTRLKNGTEKRRLGLANALFSRVQLRVLALLIGQPDRSYQLTEIIQLAGSGRGAIQRELWKLTEAGIVTLTLSQKRKTYQANRESPIFSELYNLVVKTVGLVDPLRKALERYRPKILVAFVYGSVAKGTDTAKSDIDLMIIGRDLAYSEIYTALHKPESTLLRSVNPTLMMPDEWKQKIADKNAFVRGIQQQPKLFVLGTDDDLQGIG
jgi:predicted nucleotidyltransferase